MQGVEGYRARVTPTHAGVDSRGVMKVGPLELEGSGYITMIMGVGGTIFGGILSIMTNIPVAAKIVFSLFPIGIALAYQLLLVQGKPPAYRADLFSTFVDGKHWFTKPHKWTKRPHPLGLSVRHTSLDKHHG